MVILQAESDRFLGELHPTDQHSLTKIDKTKQYAAAPCAMGPGICLYGMSESSGVESMNRANKPLVRMKPAVDILNASILLLRVKGGQFNSGKEKAWNWDQSLTPKGMDIMRDVFDSVRLIKFRLSMQEDETHHIGLVRKNLITATEYQVRIPKVAYLESYFGTCTCGIPAKEGVPCKHMVVIVKSSAIPGLTRMGIMPYFWSTEQWKHQYPIEVMCNTNVTMAQVKLNTTLKDDRLRYCPDWSIGKKPGRPKKNDKHKTVMDHIQTSSLKKRKRQKKMYCKICKKWNHTTEQCWKNPTNRSLESLLNRGLKAAGEGEEGLDQDGMEGAL
jgi:hypothetical protein